MENWKDLYQELSKALHKECKVKWIDLWHNQVNFLEEEHPFPSPAIFLSFRIVNTQDLGDLNQKAQVQIDVYYFYETFADTNHGAINQNDALEFLDGITKIHQCLHGSEGQNYSSMRRVGFAPVDTGSAQNLYVQNFTCELVDTSAKRIASQVETELNIVGSIHSSPFVL